MKTLCRFCRCMRHDKNPDEKNAAVFSLLRWRGACFGDWSLSA